MFTLPCAIIMLQIKHIECLLTAITVFNNTGYTMLYNKCTIYRNTFRFTWNHILYGMTVSNIQLLIGVYDSGKKFANFERNIKSIIDNAK